MNGPEHYAEAERLIDPHALKELAEGEKAAHGLAMIEAAVATAQVHATLALAAAMAEQSQSTVYTRSREWKRVLG